MSHKNFINILCEISQFLDIDELNFFLAYFIYSNTIVDYSEIILQKIEKNLKSLILLEKSNFKSDNF